MYTTKKHSLKLLSKADGVTTVCDAWLKMQRDTYPNPIELKGKQFILTNGFDPQDNDFIQPTPLSKENLHIIYAGKLIGDRRDPSMLFKVISKLIKSDMIPEELIKIHYCGRESEIIDRKSVV